MQTKDLPQGQRKGKQRILDIEFPLLRWIPVTPGGQHSIALRAQVRKQSAHLSTLHSASRRRNNRQLLPPRSCLRRSSLHRHWMKRFYYLPPSHNLSLVRYRGTDASSELEEAHITCDKLMGACSTARVHTKDSNQGEHSEATAPQSKRAS